MFETDVPRTDPKPQGRLLDEWSENERSEDDRLEESLEETFPASDPASSNRFD